MTELISSHKESDVQKDLYNMAHRTSSYQWQEQDSHCQSRAASFTMGKETQKEKKKRRSGRLVAGEAHVTNTHPKQWLLLYTFEDSTVNQPSNKTYTKCCRPPSHLLLSNVLNNQNSDYIYLRHWWIWKVFSCHLPPVGIWAGTANTMVSRWTLIVISTPGSSDWGMLPIDTWKIIMPCMIPFSEMLSIPHLAALKHCCSQGNEPRSMCFSENQTHSANFQAWSRWESL